MNTPHPLAIILCGGLGTRLGNLTADIQKCMLPVGNKPFLEHILKQLSDQNFKKVLLLTGYKSDSISKYFGDGKWLGLEIDYLEDQHNQGTAYALWQAKEYIDERFLLLYGDIYRMINYTSLIKEEPNLLGVYQYSEGLTTVDFPNIQLNSDCTKVLSYSKQNINRLCDYVDAGFGYFYKQCIDHIEPVGSFESQAYTYLSQESVLKPYIVDDIFWDIGNPDDLERAQNSFN